MDRIASTLSTEDYDLLEMLAACESQSEWADYLLENHGANALEPAHNVLQRIKASVGAVDDVDLLNLFAEAAESVDRMRASLQPALRQVVPSDGVKRPFRLADYKPYPYDIPTVHLQVELMREKATIESTMTVVPKPQQSNVPMVLEGKHLDLGSVIINGRELPRSEYEVTDDQLVIKRPPAEEFTLQIRNCARIHDGALSGLYHAEKGVYVTQCEAEGFARITYHPNRPDVLSCYTTSIICDKRYNLAVAGGECTHKGMYDERRRIVTWKDEFPKPSYLFAMAVGRFSKKTCKMTTPSGKKLAVEFYVPSKYKGSTACAWSALKHAICWDEERYGEIYDKDVLRIIAVRELDAAAMENSGCFIFNDEYLFFDQDEDSYSWLPEVTRTVIHEYGHQRRGNRVTIRDWSQVAVKEGLTCLMEELCSSDYYGDEAQRLLSYEFEYKVQSQRYDKLPKARAIRLAEWSDPEMHKTIGSYCKAPELFRMMHTMVGDAGWQAVMRRLSTEFDAQAVTLEDLVAVVDRATGVDVSGLIPLFDNTALPELAVEMDYNPFTRVLNVTFEQGGIEDAATEETIYPTVPVKFALFDKDGEPIKLKQPMQALRAGETDYEHVLISDGPRNSFSFVDVDRPPVPSLLRGGLGGVDFDVACTGKKKLGYKYSDQELMTLFEFDTDAIARYDAGRRLINAEIADASRLGKYRPDSDLIALMGRVIRDDSLSPGLRARLIHMPVDAYEAGGYTLCPKKSLEKGIERFGRELAQQLEPELVQLIDRKLQQPLVKGAIMRWGECQLIAEAARMIGYIRGERIVFLSEVVGRGRNGAEQMALLEAMPKEYRAAIASRLELDLPRRRMTAIGRYKATEGLSSCPLLRNRRMRKYLEDVVS